MRKLLDYLRYAIALTLIRAGVLKSPSMTVLGLNQNDYDARATSDGIVWTLRQPPRIDNP